MGTAKFHALAAASSMLRKQVPKGARAWSRALPALEVCAPNKMNDLPRIVAESRPYPWTQESQSGYAVIRYSWDETAFRERLSMEVLGADSRRNSRPKPPARAGLPSSNTSSLLSHLWRGDVPTTAYFSPLFLFLWQAKNTVSSDTPTIDAAHFEPLGSWSSEKLNSSRQANPFMMTWVPGAARHNVPNMTHGSGVYLYDDQGNQYLDWTSQAVCSNLGHDVPSAVVEAAAYQMRQLPFTYGGIGMTEVRTRMNQLMNEVLPGDLRPAVFPSSGAEANEAGIMMARRFTGRQKVISWYRSYHGATANAGAATGDLRRWYGSDSVPGFVKAFNPFPLFFNHGGHLASEEERVQSALAMLEEQILNEGPDNIASIMMESIVGAGGCLIMPDGYMQGVRAICDKYGILMHCDEGRCCWCCWCCCSCSLARVAKELL